MLAGRLGEFWAMGAAAAARVRARHDLETAAGTLRRALDAACAGP